MTQPPKLALISALAGAAIMAYFGSRIGIRSGAGSGTVALFAIGLFLMVNAGFAAVWARVRQLEDRLAKLET